MSTPSQKYALIVGASAALVVVVALVGLLFRLQDGVSLWIFSYFPFAASAALLVSVPVSLFWMIYAAWRKKWAAVKSMAVALTAAFVAFGGAVAATWRIMRELFPA